MLDVSRERGACLEAYPGDRKQQKTIEARYQKKEPVEHILDRPESYIGSVQLETQQLWVWDLEEECLKYKNIEYVPGLYKIFDEILVNAADNKAREDTDIGRGRGDQRMTCIKVEIDPSIPEIMIYNDGEGIPVEIHQEYGIYVPELIFGHLLTSENFDDTEARVTGGRNGYGAKLANIFSRSFQVECYDSSRNRLFKKKWSQNMSRSDPEKITKGEGSHDYVKVTFRPDLKRFKLDSLTPDMQALLSKRVYDVCGTTGLKVWLNGKKLPINSFKSYVDLYFKQPKSSETNEASNEEIAAADSKNKNLKIHEKGDRWEVVISLSSGQFQQVSFVNSVCTIRGGTHVNYVLEPLVQAVIKKVNAKNKGGMDVKANQIKEHLWIFIKALIVNPTFDSQTKETLTLKPSQFGSKFVLSEKTIQAVMKSDILESVLIWFKTKQQIELQRRMKSATSKGGRDRVQGLPKLEDANDAGSKSAQDCVLILTEGESAKTSCVAGLSVVGKDRYGVFPLRGKLLNVREATFKQQVENQEIQAILKIMGLQVGKDMNSPQGLRYGSIMLMTDQDLDGSHIKGLLINMIAHFWPGLLKCRGFLKQFITPIVKVAKGKEKLSFYTLAEYEQWKLNNDQGKGWKTRYYKGLGTSTDQEFKEYFQQLQKHSLNFVYDGEHDLNAIDMAFNGKRAEERKQWIQAYEEGTYVDYSKPVISYTDFINKELVVFSKYDTFRSIPNCIDGLKPVQRKVLFAALKKKMKSEMKVAQFASYVAGVTAYHHGEQGLWPTIVAMAQTFVGANNIALFEACGQFGSRKEGGKDASAARYIFTRLTHFARALFPEADDALLQYQNDDGLLIEPKYYVPVIPLVLVNGAEGIGTGWSTFVPNYNPREIIANVRRFIRGEPLVPMSPWYKGFRGTMERTDRGGFESVGCIEEIDPEQVRVTELPVKMWTQNFRQLIEDSMVDRSADNAERGNRGRRAANAGGGSGFGVTIKDYRDNSSHEFIDFTIQLAQDQMQKAQLEGLDRVFKLRKALSISNLTLFDSTQKVQRYASELDILKEFGQLRLQYYELRKAYLIEKAQRECRILQNKVRFIESVLNGSLNIRNKKRDELIKELTQMKFNSMSDIKKESVLMMKLEDEASQFTTEVDSPENEVDQEALLEAKSSHYKDFDYLLGMTLWCLTAEKVETLIAQHAQAAVELQELKLKSVEDLWEADLRTLEAALDHQDILDEAAMRESLALLSKEISSRSNKPFGKQAPAKKRKIATKKPSQIAASSDSSSENFSDNNEGTNAVRASRPVQQTTLDAFAADSSRNTRAMPASTSQPALNKPVDLLSQSLADRVRFRAAEKATAQLDTSEGFPHKTVQSAFDSLFDYQKQVDVAKPSAKVDKKQDKSSGRQLSSGAKRIYKKNTLLTSHKSTEPNSELSDKSSSLSEAKGKTELKSKAPQKRQLIRRKPSSSEEEFDSFSESALSSDSDG